VQYSSSTILALFAFAAIGASLAAPGLVAAARATAPFAP
jgi:hypothetical protein